LSTAAATRDHANAPKEGEGRRLSIGSLGVAGIAGISLSSVTATVGSVGKQIGAISGLDIQAQARGSNNSSVVQHPTLLHRKLYELNAQIHLGIQQYFENLFGKNLDELSKISSDCLTINTYLQETAQSLHKTVEQCSQIDDAMKNMSDSFSKTKLPRRK